MCRYEAENSEKLLQSKPPIEAGSIGYYLFNGVVLHETYIIPSIEHSGIAQCGDKTHPRV